MTYNNNNEPGWENPGSAKIKELLEKARTIAIVGLSSNTARPSYGVAKFLQEKGYKIIPVNPGADEILGEKAYPDLGSLPEVPDIVDVFRRSEHASKIVEEAIKKNAGVVWLQEGVVSPEAFRAGREAGMTMVMDRCMAKEYRKLME